MSIKLLEGKNLTIVLLTMALMAVSIPLGMLIWALISNGLGLTQTGQIGDTIGGTAGALINGIGLLLVYSSFQAQIKANELQNQLMQDQKNDFDRQRQEFQETMDRQANESFFDLTLKIVERFSEAVERQQHLFLDVPSISYRILNDQRITSSERMGATKLIGQEEFITYQRQFFILTEFFNVISRRINDTILTGDQKLVLIDLLDVSYGALVKTAIIKYQQIFGVGVVEKHPDDMYYNLDRQDILLFQLRKDAETQAAFERIPYGNEE